MIIFEAILASFLLCLVSCIGAINLKGNIKNYTSIFLPLATGAILGDIFFHLLPEITEIEDPAFNKNLIFGLILLGILFMFLIEILVKDVHNHNTEIDKTHLSKLNLIGNSLHNFIDGVLIGSSFLIDPSVGWATTFAILLHEIPVELGNYVILIHSGYSKGKALFYNFLSSLFGLTGTLLVVIVGYKFESVLVLLTSFAVGFLLYISMSDLIPEIHNIKSKKRFTSLFLILTAIIFMFLLKYFEKN
jgi:zinc and cadmium transporter